MVAEFEFPDSTDPSAGDVAIAGGNLAIGVPGSLNGTGFVQTGLLGGSALAFVEGGDALKFGSALDLTFQSGRFSLLVGATGTEEADTTRQFGSAEYYTFDGQQWTRFGNPMVPQFESLQENGEFGFSVAMAISTLRCAIGAPSSRSVFTFPSGPVELETGRIYTFEFNGTEWIEMTAPLVGAFTARVGTSVDMSSDGSRLLGGAPAFEGGDGGVAYYVWNPVASGWDSIFTLGGTTLEELGTTVAIISDDGGTIAFGGPSFGDDQGAIRVYSQIGNSFAQVGEVITGQMNERIGMTLAGFNSRIAFGTATNVVRVYEFTSDNWVEVISIPVSRSIVSLAITKDGTSVAVGMEGALTQVFAVV